ncbi:cystathionine gamma-synthase [Corynebacterium canis]|uniref:Cystathionine gamma-synthase n=1 Tax=Corynebacterium canis TaxID=679663 RepID=A0A5C5UMD1_9CORY|nr:cystathionine gamma-synthase [Corynebacterium canis]TWT26505.1 cystathionine gamma-synthase [Corynebacterium canis]WJY76025.1 Cystathionine gamma-synthase [Corynebacterium canis]
MPGFATSAIHAGYDPDAVGAVNPPIYASTTYVQDGLNQLRAGFEYTRCGNPTTAVLESLIAQLEGGQFGRAFASGMAATDVLLRAVLRPGDHIILGNDAYGGTYRLIDSVFAAWGVEYSVANLSDLDAVAAELRPNTKLIWVETPTNPALGIADIAGIRALASAPTLVVDNTFATPYLQQPLSLGADVVLHSSTKYLGGHSDVVGGLVVTNDAELDEQLAFLQGGAGAIPSPFDAYLTIRGIKTLPVRMAAHCRNAQAIAEYLEGLPQIKQVLYPGLPSCAGHEVARRQMSGFGGMISVRFHSEEAARHFCTNTKLIYLAESLGGVESLLEHPATMTHQSAAGSQLEVPRDLVRISVGIEDLDDLLADITAALPAA